MLTRRQTFLAATAVPFIGLADPARAEDKVVKIGAVFPMTGNAASAGIHAKYAIEVALDIINNAHPELGDLPLAKNAGLAGLGGAKVEVVFADNQGSPATGQNQALRLITEEKVVALTGAYQSGITLTASAIACPFSLKAEVIVPATEVPYSVLSCTSATLSVLAPDAFISVRKS